MRYEDYDPLSKKVIISMTETDLADLDVFIGYADMFLKKLDKEKTMSERDRIFRIENEFQEILNKFSGKKKEYEDYARANG